MQYKIPQDTGTEETFLSLGIVKISLRQLIILFAGFGVGYLLYLSLFPVVGSTLALIPAGVVALITLAFAFVRKDNMSFARMLLLMIERRINPIQRHWIPNTGMDSPFDQLLGLYSSPDTNATPVVRSSEEAKVERISALAEALDTAPVATVALERLDETAHRTAERSSRLSILERLATEAAKRVPHSPSRQP